MPFSQPRTRLLVLAAIGLSGCSSHHSRIPPEPGFGNTVRQALQAQQLPSVPATPAGVPFSELGPALDRQQKAKPIESTASRNPQGSTALQRP